MAGEGLRILVIGGGFSGMSAAIELRKIGAQVDLVEIDPGWRSYGAGISMGGASMRALRRLGVLPQFLEQGDASDGVDLYTANGHKIASLPTPRVAGPDVPGSGAVLRPALAAILAKATRESGARVKLGATFETLNENGEVRLSDGTAGRYDLVVGADGLNSQTRAALFPEAPKPAYVGQCVWRAVAPRAPDIDRATMWMGHKVKVGLNPVSRTQMYMFVTEDRPTNDRIAPERFAGLLADLLAPFTAPTIQAVRAGLPSNETIVYRPLEALLLPRPWSKGRVALIGDAAHATTPHLASGACIGIEDAIVLAEELARADVPTALAGFEERRYERCRMVVQNSLRLAEIEIAGGEQGEAAAIMGKSMMALAAPI